MQVLDRDHFSHMTAGDRALQREVTALFSRQVEGWRQGFAGPDWRRAVHTLKGSARGIGLDALAAACEAAEAAPDGGEAAALGEICRALDLALAALDSLAADAA